MLCILSQQLFLQFLDSLEVTVSVQFRTFFHSCERSPALRIYDICVLKRLFHAVCLCEGAAGFLCIFSSDSLNLREYLVSFGMSQDNVHSETCHQADHTLGNRERLSVGRRVSPGHCNLLSFEIFNSSELVDNVEHIRHCLCRVVNIALQVYKSRFLLQDPVFISLGYRVNNFVHVSISLSDVHIVADADDVSHKGNHVCRLPDRLAVCHLGFALVQILHLKA